MDWQGAYDNDARFAYVEATEDTFSQQHNGSYNVGMTRGRVPLRPPDSSSGTVQADYFINDGGGRTLPPALTLQNNPSCAQGYGLSAAAMASWIKAFSDELHLKTSKYPMITTSFAWWKACPANSALLPPPTRSG